MAKRDFPIEVTAPDIAPYRAGNTGIDYVTTFDSDRPGPHAMINAVTHGNEICGAIALDHLFRHDIRPARGRLTLAFVNHAAYRRFDPARPRDNRRIDQDINRVWADEVLDGPGDTVELRRARELRPVVETVDHLLDIHSLGTDCPALLLCTGQPKETALARAIGFPAHVILGRKRRSRKRMIDYGPFADPETPRTGLLVECGQHWARQTAVNALDTALRFLRGLDIIDQATLARHVSDRLPAPQRLLRITGAVEPQSHDFAFRDEFHGLEHFPAAGTVIARDGDADIVTPHDDCILVMPNARAKKGMRAVRFARVVG
ncbi:MAG: succinylglutamate desuccinylase/aspartoacylase family protein [Alphaproteobacteria bacterium]